MSMLLNIGQYDIYFRESFESEDVKDEFRITRLTICIPELSLAIKDFLGSEETRFQVSFPTQIGIYHDRDCFRFDFRVFGFGWYYFDQWSY